MSPIQLNSPPLADLLSRSLLVLREVVAERLHLNLSPGLSVVGDQKARVPRLHKHINEVTIGIQEWCSHLYCPQLGQRALETLPKRPLETFVQARRFHSRSSPIRDGSPSLPKWTIRASARNCPHALTGSCHCAVTSDGMYACQSLKSADHLCLCGLSGRHSISTSTRLLSSMRIASNSLSEITVQPTSQSNHFRFFPVHSLA